jgi:E3 ubiquitin-protein ligase SIAH1
VESVHVRCPNEAYGCFVRPVYYDQHNHIQRCVHAPCYCPEVACDFIGSKSALWNHVSGVHSWPRSKGMASKKFDICLHDGLDVIYERMNVINLRVGYNFILVDSASDSNSHGTTYTATTSNQYLFLLNMARQSPGHSISVLCIHPQASGDGQGSSPKEVTFELSYTGRGDSRPCGCGQVIEHYQKSRFRVACTNLSDGLTSLDACFQFVVPDSVAADNDRDTILVTARIIIE